MKWKNAVMEIVIVLIGTIALLTVFFLMWKNGFLSSGAFGAADQVNRSSYIINVLSNGWSVFVNNIYLIFTLFNCIIFGSIIIILVIHAIYGAVLEFSDYFTLSIAGSFIVLFIVGLLILGLGMFYDINNDVGVLIIILNITLGSYLYFSRIFLKGRKSFDTNIFFVLSGLILFFAVLYLVRLAFIYGTQFPLYFDSIKHYSDIQSFLSADKSPTLNQIQSFFVYYYHFGFHIIATGITSISGKPIQDVMLVLGQTTLAIIPLPLFSLIKHETRLNSAGFFTVLLGALGWSMPADSVNWGKYPAITSLIFIEFTLCIAYLMIEMEKGKQKTMALGLVFLTISSSTLTHSRSLFVILLGIICWLAADKWLSLSWAIRLWSLIFVLLGVVSIIVTIYQEPILRSVFDPYLREGSLATLLVLLLFPFAMMEFPKMAFANLLMTFSLLLCLFVPMPLLFSSYGYQTLLDRPYIEISLYLPFSLIGGVGFAAVMKMLVRVFDGTEMRRKRIIPVFLAVVLWAGVIGNAFSSYSFYASDCCKLIANDDLDAYKWINQNLPKDAFLWIAASKGTIAPSESSVVFGATDGGGWVTILAHRETKGLIYSSDFGIVEVQRQMCERKNNYIYVGSGTQSFDRSKLENVPGWYEKIFSLPTVQIFSVVRCAH